MTVLGALARRGETRAVQATAWGDWGDGGSRTWAGPAVSSDNAWQLLTVYGCVSYIADGISTLPVDVLRRQGDGSPVVLRAPMWLQQPTTDLDVVAWTGQVLSSLLLAGNAYCFKTFRDGMLDQLIPLDPGSVRVTREQGRKVYRVNGQLVDPFEMLHIPAVMLPGSDVGLSPVEAARQTIGAGMAAEEYAARFLDQDSTPGGVIEVPGELPPDKAVEMARAWARKHGGKSKTGLPGVLQGGATWKPTAVTNEQAQFLETRKYTAGAIAAQLFKIDPPEMGIGVDGQSLTYSNQEDRNTRKVQVTFLPWIVRLERALSRLLPRPQYVKFNVNGLLRGDMKARFEAYAIGIDNQFMVPNEAREFEDWEPLEGGDAVAEPPSQVPVEVKSERVPVVRTVERDELGQVVRVVEQ